MERGRDSRIWLGDDCYLNLNGAVLVKDGETKYLTPIEFRLLRYLAEHMGEVVLSNELIVRGWGENTMAQRDELYVFIHQIRVQLEDNPENPTCLKTVRRRGYILYPRRKYCSSCTLPPDGIRNAKT
ncbi:winged helix-turn-helix domain-containing protein [Alicyclobacillus curvatus]|nr:winged helix-turn-helix domain-containing protein [Alicyclobacillus curvatus]